MELDLEVTSVFERNQEAYENKAVRFIINQGSSRSSKSISILQLLIFICLTKEKQNISIVRQSLPVLRSTIMNDFIELMIGMNLYDINAHNKTESKYRFKNGSVIKFISTDEPQKLRGLKHSICYINEANEIDLEIFTQLNIRTSEKIIMDFNPSEIDSYIYDLLIREPDKCCLIHSTYKDNVFLGKEQIDEIEALVNVDPEYYRIYALGLPPTNNAKIYNHIQFTDSIPDFYKLVSMGIDFGYNDPCSLLEVWEWDKQFIINQRIYQSYLTTSELIKLMNDLEINKSTIIWADYSRPEIIKEIRTAGYKIENANKDIKEGINSVKSSLISFTNTSTETIKESKQYMWKTKDSLITDQPIDLHNHSMDALRYAIHTYKIRNKITPLKVYSLPRQNKGY